MTYASLPDSAYALDCIWKGKIDPIRYRGLHVTFGSEVHYAPQVDKDDTIYPPVHQIFRPLVVG